MRIILSLLLLILASEVYPQKLLTLEEAIRIALQKNVELKKTENTLQTYEADIKSAFGNFLPSVNGQVSWDWTRSEEEGGLRSLPNGGVFYLPKAINETRSYSLGAGTSWILFDGLSNIKTYEKSKLDYESYALSIERAKQNVVFQTISLYYEIVNNQKLLQVKKEDVVWNQANLETVTEKNKIGTIPVADVYAQQVRAGNAELEVIRTSNVLETAKTNLLYYLGLDVMSGYTFSDTLFLSNDLKAQSFKNIQDLVSTALSNRLDYKSQQLNLESAQKSVAIAKAGYYPTLSNDIRYYTYSDNVSDLFKSNSISLGLTLTIPIFSNFRTENQVEFATVNVKNNELTVSELERDIKRKIQQTYLDIEASEKALDVSKRNVTAAEENRRVESEKYNIGAGTLLNVLIANSEYMNAQTNYINSQFSYNVLIEQLNFLIGSLDHKKYE